MQVCVTLKHTGDDDAITGFYGKMEWNYTVLPNIGQQIDYSVFKDCFFLGGIQGEDVYYQLSSKYIWRVKDVVWNKDEVGFLIPTMALAGNLKPEFIPPITYG